MARSSVIADLYHVAEGGTATAKTQARAVPLLVPSTGPVVALRRCGAVALGGLANRSTIRDGDLVAARDLKGTTWWIPASAVWSDAAEAPHPTKLIGMNVTTARTREGAIVAGVSNRLGWEAVREFENGADLRLIERSGGLDDVLVFDGRLSVDLPTVVVVGEDLVRWGAGATWELALQRAVFRHGAGHDTSDELEQMQRAFAQVGLSIGAVDLETGVLASASVHRTSVQVLDMIDGMGRSWDASPMN